MSTPGRPLLDPATVGAITATWSPTLAFDTRIREFGSVPDFSRMMPGDLVLTAPTDPDRFQRYISAAQQAGGHDAFDAQFTHVLMYAGDEHHVFESVFEFKGLVDPGSRGGVRLGSIFDYVGPEHRLLVRRPPCDESKRLRLIIEAAASIGRRYGVGYILKCLWRTRAGWWSRRPGPGAMDEDRRFHVCSSLYQDALAGALGLKIAERSGICAPATLSSTRSLVDVDVGWARIVPHAGPSAPGTIAPGP